MTSTATRRVQSRLFTVALLVLFALRDSQSALVVRVLVPPLALGMCEIVYLWPRVLASRAALVQALRWAGVASIAAWIGLRDPSALYGAIFSIAAVLAASGVALAVRPRDGAA